MSIQNKTACSRRGFLAGAGAAALAAGSTGLIALADEDKGAELNTIDILDRKWSFEIPPEPVPEENIVETITADIIVVGSGMSGLCTAASAIDNGGDVVVISASTIPLSRGGSNCGIGTKYQKELGIDASPASMSHFLRTIQFMTAQNNDQRKWYKWINNSAETVDWMIDLMADAGLYVSLEYGCDDPDGILTSPPHSHNFWNEENPMGCLQGAPLQAAAYAAFIQNHGGTIYYSTAGKYLEREGDKSGRVTGIIAQRLETGEYVRYAANKAVVLATGDFTRDPEMMAKYAPETYNRYKDQIPWGQVDYDAIFCSNGMYAGDGHKMALWAGAAWQKTYPATPMEHPNPNYPLAEGMGNFMGINLAPDGKRFINENVSSAFVANALEHMRGDAVYYIWDADYVKTHETWPFFGASIDGSNGMAATTQEEQLASWEQKVENGDWFKADTLDELLAQLDGLDAENAKVSIENWNRYCEQGYDEEFQLNPKILAPIKTPPFYGVYNTREGFHTLLTICGGIRANEDMQVLDETDTPIDGLYCTGTMLGDFYANTYGFAIFGQNLGGVCCTLSCLLGRDLAKL